MLTQEEQIDEEKLNWQIYFEQENKSFFKRLCRLHRTILIARAGKVYTNRYFPEQGVFLEAGSGTSQSSSMIEQKGRKLIALDLNYYVLAEHNVLPLKVQGDIFKLPVLDNSVDGIWNYGVMEHFTDQQIIDILKDMKRAVKPGGKLILFWPPPYAPFQIVLNSITWFAKTFFNKRVDFFPDEINRYKTKKRAQWFLESAGLKLVNVHFTIIDLFSYAIVVAEK